MFTGMLHTHKLVVILFLLLYLIKTILLLLNKVSALQTFIRKTRIAEMIISFAFLATGVYLAMKSGNTGNWLWFKIIAIALSIPIAVVAFKKLNKGLAALSLLLIIYAYGVSETKAPFFKKEKVENEFANTDKAMLGKRVFESKCQTCHGPDGKLGLSGAKDLTASTLNRDEKIEVVRNGKNSMMSYKDVLTDDEINAVVDYVEGLKQ